MSRMNPNIVTQSSRWSSGTFPLIAGMESCEAKEIFKSDDDEKKKTYGADVRF